MKRAALITVKDATVRFGSKVALDRVSLCVHRGESLIFIGANGSGKTTLIRLLHRLAPGAEQVQVHPLEPEGRLPRLSMLFQRPFFLSFSVRWNVQLGLWLHGVPARERRARALNALERVGLAKLVDRVASDLSAGQQQRLAMARAWALQPDVIFLDEPTANLDPTAKREVEKLIQDFIDDGVTVVMSTHNLGQAKRLAHRVVYLEEGQILADLPVAEFFTRPDLPDAVNKFLKGELPW